MTARSWRTYPRLPWRALTALLVIVAAYHYSLLSLARGITLQTPLAYLAAVPVIALLLAWVRIAREPAPRPIHDRQLDYILGIGLVLAAAVVAIVVPISMSHQFWLQRLDLIGLPLFASGVVILFFGVRHFWALRVPIGFLFLSWPVPYLPLVGDGMRISTDVTVSVLAWLSQYIPLATPGTDEGLFHVRHGDQIFPLSVATACSGVNSLVGFLLVGGALNSVLRGSLWRRLAWLASGIVFIWLLNLIRIEAIFAAGAMWGQTTAIDILHPVAGLVLFNLGVLIMLMLTRRFGLGFLVWNRASVEPDHRPIVSPIRRIRFAFVGTAVAALILATVNAGYASYEAISGPTGEARLVPFDVRQAQVPDWESVVVGRYDQGRQFFGAESTWDRMLYSATDGAALRVNSAVYVDVVTTDDVGTLAAYGLEACYRFHGFEIDSIVPVEIGAGTTAEVINYHSVRYDSDWSALWWEWPYQSAAGETRYERIVVFVANGPELSFAGEDIAAVGDSRFAETTAFLAAMARDIVASQLTAAGGAT